MPYSLLNASTLGLDLARSPAGTQVADVLLTGLAAGQRAVAVVRRGIEPAALPDRAAGLRLVAGRPVVPAADPPEQPAPGDPPSHGGLPATGPPVGVPPPRADLPDPAEPDDADARAAGQVATRLRSLLARWRQVSFGSVDDLLDLARDLPAGAWRGEDPRARSTAAALTSAVLHDAVLASAVRETGEPGAVALADRLAAPFSALQPFVPPIGGIPVADAVPGVPALAELLALLARTPADRLRGLAGHRLPPGQWARHVHDACWAIELTGRVDAAAAAQLDLVRALRAAGVAPADDLHGIWNAASAAVAVHVTADLTGEGARRLLADPVRELLGLRPLG